MSNRTFKKYLCIFFFFTNITHIYIGVVVLVQKSPAKLRAQVDRVFFKNLKALLKIAIPGVASPEAGFMLLVAVSLVGRTFCDLWMIQKTTSIET